MFFLELESQATLSVAGDQELVDEELPPVEEAQEVEMNDELCSSEELGQVYSEDVWEESKAESVSEMAPALECVGMSLTFLVFCRLVFPWVIQLYIYSFLMCELSDL